MLLAQVEVVAETTAQMIGRIGLLAFVMVVILAAALWGFYYILTVMHPAAIKRAQQQEDKAHDEVKSERERGDKIIDRFDKALERRDKLLGSILEQLTDKIQHLADRIDDCPKRSKASLDEQTPIPSQKPRGA